MRTHTLHVLSLTAALLSLTACNGSSHDGGDNGPAVAVDDLAAGAYIVSVGSPDDFSIGKLGIGKYYADANGQRLLVMADGDDRANALYRRKDSNSKWVAIPKPDAAVTISFVQSTALVVDDVDVAAIAGSYQTRLPNGDAADFVITVNGDITAGDSSCKLSGEVDAGSLSATLALTLTLNAANCGSLPATVSGVLIVDRDYAPAAFRLVGDDDNTIVDLWAYAE